MNVDALMLIERALRKVEATHYEERRDKAVAPAIKHAEPRIADVFRKQGELFIQQFASLRGQFAESITQSDLGTLFDAAEGGTSDAMTSWIADAVSMALQAGAKMRIGDLKMDLSFDLKNPRAVAYLGSRGAANVKKINDTTRDYIKTVVTQGVDEGWSYDRMAKAITARYAEFAIGQPQEHIDSRAHLIAVQESGMAYEHGNRFVIDDLVAGGLEMEHSSLSVGDERVSEICAANEAEGWIPIDQTHLSGDPQPPFHVACRCTELYRRKGSE